MSLEDQQPELFGTGSEPGRARCTVVVNENFEFTRLEMAGAAQGTLPNARLEVDYECGQLFEGLRWCLTTGQEEKVWPSLAHANSIRAALNALRKELDINDSDLCAIALLPAGSRDQKPEQVPVSVPPGPGVWTWLAHRIRARVERQRAEFFAHVRRAPRADDPPAVREARDFEAALRTFRSRQNSFREARAAAPAFPTEKELRAEAEQRARIHAASARQQQREREERLKRQSQRTAASAMPPCSVAPSAPLPEVAVHFERLGLQIQETLLTLSDFRDYFLRERAAVWWVSNQSDDLLALPYCNIQRLEYQIRTALRVIGPLRGRALLSDEVGLGKTIEAGLVLKEYLTRGLVKRFLVLTVPSLVDQWQEELAEKFRLETATTNQSPVRERPEQFWRENTGIVASLHTLKQAAHLAIAQTVKWDLLIVDEAHYLRNRTSQAWQAVEALPRQFLLLLTATPVQNSLEELYNLVTLLQPGQLPSPKEFRTRFIDPKKPHQPREPEELRRLLGQVMVRNTRANAGINLPPRRAETVLFEPAADERTFWGAWEKELRDCLSGFSASQATLWGRLLLQTAGSSPAAWLEVLKSFPDQALAAGWSKRAPLESSWRKKCQLLEPLTKGEGGVVIFTQYLQTQAALAAVLEGARTPTFVINGQTPPAERQPITEAFRQRGGALLLTHSGTEGRNLQFCHRLVNFDLPWNPMEIEQRIGRLHRLGQQHPVRIFNLVQAGTLQEHLLEILQEKLNLFELVVGETGLILGDRYSGEEFAEEVLRRWRESEGRVAEAMQTLGDELAAARQQYGEIQKLDETLFSKDYESL